MLSAGINRRQPIRYLTAFGKIFLKIVVKSCQYVIIGQFSGNELPVVEALAIFEKQRDITYEYIILEIVMRASPI